VGKLVWVFGGMASSVMEDLWLLDVDTMVWRPLVPTCSRPKDKPEKMHAAAMCSTGSTLWLFGGQQGRKYLRTLYSLDTETLSWRMCNPAGAAPPGRAGHTLTAVADHAVYLFGGQGKKLYNDLYVMHGDGGDWLELKPSGKAPAPRTGHTMVWDGKDRLIVFGGTAGSNTDNGVFVYSLSSNQWSMPTVSGMLPSSRTHHTAVMLPGAAHMLVFGGCNAQVRAPRSSSDGHAAGGGRRMDCMPCVHAVADVAWMPIAAAATRWGCCVTCSAWTAAS
jgi:hypothetical protein